MYLEDFIFFSNMVYVIIMCSVYYFCGNIHISSIKSSIVVVYKQQNTLLSHEKTEKLFNWTYFHEELLSLKFFNLLIIYLDEWQPS